MKMKTFVPRIAICIPSGDEIKTDFAMALAALTWITKAPIAICNAKSSIVAIGRNLLVEQAQKVGATHMLFLDSDVVFPPETLDILLAHKKDIVGCVYSRRVPPYMPIGTPLGGKDIEVYEGLHGMQMLPTGCLLIKMTVFEKMKKPYFRGSVDEEKGSIIGEDVKFCQDVLALGYDIWCDVGLSGKIGHIGQRTFYTEGE